MPTLTYHGVVIPAGHECVGLTRTPVTNPEGMHVYDEYTLHLRVPSTPEPPRAPSVPAVPPHIEAVMVAQLKIAVREACAGAERCKLKTLSNHVTANSVRFRELNDLTMAQIGDLAKQHLKTWSRDGTLWVG